MKRIANRENLKKEIQSKVLQIGVVLADIIMLCLIAKSCNNLITN